MRRWGLEGHLVAEAAFDAAAVQQGLHISAELTHHLEGRQVQGHLGAYT